LLAAASAPPSATRCKTGPRRRTARAKAVLGYTVPHPVRRVSPASSHTCWLARCRRRSRARCLAPHRGATLRRYEGRG
jgi:hypothetical protein